MADEFHLEPITVSVGHEEESEALVTRCSRATRKPVFMLSFANRLDYNQLA